MVRAPLSDRLDDRRAHGFAPRRIDRKVSMYDMFGEMPPFGAHDRDHEGHSVNGHEATIVEDSGLSLPTYGPL